MGYYGIISSKGVKFGHEIDVVINFVFPRNIFWFVVMIKRFAFQSVFKSGVSNLY